MRILQPRISRRYHNQTKLTDREHMLALQPQPLRKRIIAFLFSKQLGFASGSRFEDIEASPAHRQKNGAKHNEYAPIHDEIPLHKDEV